MDVVVGIIIIWEGDVCSRGTEVLTGWLAAWLPSVRNRDARTVSERERERGKERGSEKDQKTAETRRMEWDGRRRERKKVFNFIATENE